MMDLKQLLGAPRGDWQSRKRIAVLAAAALSVLLGVVGTATMTSRHRVLEDLRKHSKLLAIHIAYKDKESIERYVGRPNEMAESGEIREAMLSLDSFVPESVRVVGKDGFILGTGTRRVMLVKRTEFPLLLRLNKSDHWYVVDFQMNPPEGLQKRFKPSMLDTVRVHTRAMRDTVQTQAKLRAILIISGLVLLLSGYWLLSDFIALPGLLMGGGAGVLIGTMGGTAGQVIGGVIGAFVGAALAKALFELFLFIFGALAGAVTLAGLWAGMIGGPPPDILLIIMAIVGGWLTIAFFKIAVCFASSLLGAWFLCEGIGLADSLFVFGVVCTVGVTIQLGVLKCVGDDED